MGLFSKLFQVRGATYFPLPQSNQYINNRDYYEGAYNVITDSTWVITDESHYVYLNMNTKTFQRFQVSQYYSENFKNAMTGSGDDYIIGDSQDNYFITQAGNDSIDGGQGSDTLVGGTGDDRYQVDSPSDLVLERAGEGNDTVFAASDYTLGNNQEVEFLSGYANGKPGLSLKGNTLNQQITGLDASNDTLEGGGGADTLVGLTGDDTYVVTSGYESIREVKDGGNDRVIVNVASYALKEDAEIERIEAGPDAIKIIGSNFSQFIVGNSANNIIDGGLGNDTLDGGDMHDAWSSLYKDVDNFRFSTALGLDNIDTIVNFHLAKEIGPSILAKTWIGGLIGQVAQFVGSLFGKSTYSDTISLSHNVFSNIDIGQLSSNQFCTLETDRLTSADRILYKKSTGALYYDADGSGSIAAVQFANVEAGLALKASHFFVYA